jgi:hypothetical protein
MRSGALGSLAGQIEMTDEMLSTARRGMTLAGKVVARAHRAGSLRPDATALDIALLIESFSRRAPGSAAPQDPDAPSEADEERNAQARLLTVAFDGLRAPGVTPLPGRAPSASRYTGRWSRGPAAGKSR